MSIRGHHWEPYALFQGGVAVNNQFWSKLKENAKKSWNFDRFPSPSLKTKLAFLRIFPILIYTIAFCFRQIYVWHFPKPPKYRDMGLNSYVSQPFSINLQVDYYGWMPISQVLYPKKAAKAGGPRQPIWTHTRLALFPWPPTPKVL